MLIILKNTLKVILLYYYTSLVQAEIIFFSWGQSIGDIDGYKLYETPDSVLAILPKESIGVTLRLENAIGRTFFIKEYKDFFEGDPSNLRTVTSFDNDVSYCMPGTINTIELYQNTYQELQIEKEKVLTLENLIVSYKATIEDQTINLVSCNTLYNSALAEISTHNFIVKKLEDEIHIRIDMHAVLVDENNKLKESMNTFMNTIHRDLINENNSLKESMNRLMNTNQDLNLSIESFKNNQNILENKNILLNEELNIIKQDLLHPNGQLWQEHWCASRETVCNIEDAFAGFKTCRYPFIINCKKYVLNPHI